MFYKRLIGAWVAVLAALILSGCVQIDYVGQTFPPLPAGEEIEFFRQQTPLPSGVYQSIGRVTMEAPDGTSFDTIKDDLLEVAREHGAQAVHLVVLERVFSGTVTPMGNSPLDGPNNSIGAGDARAPGGEYLYTNSFNQPVSMSSKPRKVYEVKIRALLLVKKEYFEKVVSEWKHEMAAAAREFAAAQPPAAPPVTPDSVADSLTRADPGVVAPERAAELKKRKSLPATKVELRQGPVTL